MYIKDFDSVIEQLKPHLSEYLEEQGIDTSQNFLCPFPDHNDTIPSCNLVGEGVRFWCHGCNRGGDILDTVHLFEDRPRVGLEWVQETLKYLADKYDVEFNTTGITKEQTFKLDYYRAYKAASKLLRSVGQEKNTAFQDELKARGWTAEALSKQDIGVVSSYADFRKALRKQGFSAQLLDSIGLDKKDLFCSDSLIYTWKDEKGRPVGFAARDLLYEKKTEDAKKKGNKYRGSKYTNTRTTEINIFQKGKSLYGLNGAIEHGPIIYVFEGQADVITARCAGLHNCVAIGGNTLREDHIQLLKSTGIYDVVLCFDGDDSGRKKLEQALEEQFAGNKDIRVRIVELPDGEDPDSYIRTHGLQSFQELAHWSSFEWKLNKYEEEEDEIDICKAMIPYIVNEPSPVVQEQMVKTLASRTGVSIKAITQELNLLLDKKAFRRNQERQDLLDKAMYELRQNPDDAETILLKAQGKLMELVKYHDTDKLSTEDFIRAIDQQKVDEEKLSLVDVGFKLGRDLKELEDIFRGDWSEGVFICIGGKANVGKTGFLCKFSHSIAANNEDVVVIYLTIDDTSEQLVPRFVTISEGSTRLSINMVRQPNYWSKTVGIQDITDRREIGYARLRELAQQGRLVIKDVKHGSSLPFIENLICYYKDQYPERRIVFVLDNFHKLRDFEGKDERVRFKQMSEAVKNITLRHHCCFIASVEYTKLAPGIKPTNYNVAESGQIEYDASAIIHLYNDVADNPHSFTVCHEDINWESRKCYLPRVELMVGKNKISEVKKSFFLDFWPASSDFRSIDQKIVLKQAKEMKETKRDNGLVDGITDEDLEEVF